MTPDDPLPDAPAQRHRGLLVTTFCTIVMGGAAGAAIAFGLINIGCHGNCATPKSFAVLGGALIGTVGVAVIAVLVLRAMVEWEQHQAREKIGRLDRQPPS